MGWRDRSLVASHAHVRLFNWRWKVARLSAILVIVDLRGMIPGVERYYVHQSASRSLSPLDHIPHNTICQTPASTLDNKLFAIE